MNNLTSELVATGLSEKEAEVYLASLALGPSSVQNIAKKAGVNRVTTYVMIEQLSQKGLMSTFDRGKKKMYVAERPERLLGVLHEREKELKGQEVRFRETLPELKSIMAMAGEKPVVRFYEGIEGFKSIHEELLVRKFDRYGEVHVQALSRGVFDDNISPARNELQRRIMQSTVSARIISIGEYKKESEFEKVPHHEVRHLSPSKFPFSAEFGIYGSMVVIYLVRGAYMGIVIDDKDVAANFELLFNVAWGMASAEYEGDG